MLNIIVYLIEWGCLSLMEDFNIQRRVYRWYAGKNAKNLCPETFLTAKSTEDVLDILTREILNIHDFYRLRLSFPN